MVVATTAAQALRSPRRAPDLVFIGIGLPVDVVQMRHESGRGNALSWATAAAPSRDASCLLRRCRIICGSRLGDVKRRERQESLNSRYWAFTAVPAAEAAAMRMTAFGRRY